MNTSSESSHFWRRFVLEHSLDAVIGINAQDEVIDWNEQAETTFGWLKQEAMGRTLVELIIPAEHRERHTQGMKRYLAAGEGPILNRRIQVPALRRSGETFQIELTVIPILSEGPPLFYSFVRDITEQLRVEEALRASESQLRLVTDALPAFVAHVGADERYRFVNRAYETWFGRKTEEIVSRPLRDIIGEAAYQAARPNIEKVLRGERAHYEATITSGNGVTMHVDAHYIPDLDTHGRVRGFVILGQDITGRKRAEEAQVLLDQANLLLSSSLDLKTTLNSVADFLVTRFADWCGIDLLNGDGVPVPMAAAHRDPEKVKFALDLRSKYPVDPNAPHGSAKVIRTGEPEIYPVVPDEVVARTARDPEHLRLLQELELRSAMIVPLRTQGKPFGTLMFFSSDPARCYGPADLLLAQELARRAALAIENARLYTAVNEAVKSRDEFLSICSHELKTPITSMMLQTQIAEKLLKREDPRVVSGETLRKLIDVSTKQLQRITRLVDDMLDVSRIATGKLTMNFEVGDLQNLVNEVVDRFRDQFNLQSVTLEVKTEYAPVFCDRFRMDQVITNLLTNALKYGENRPVTVQVQADSDRVELRVGDQGPGIAPENQEKIFLRFERAISPANISGLGLGLYICRQIVNSHHGTISVSSEIGKGSVFTVSLPRRKD